MVAYLREPLLCRLGFHKWQDYGNKIEVSWQEPSLDVGGYRYLHPHSFERHSKFVFEKCLCKRCGVKIKRKLVTNSDGTSSCIGWQPDIEETDKK